MVNGRIGGFCDVLQALRILMKRTWMAWSVALVVAAGAVVGCESRYAAAPGNSSVVALAAGGRQAAPQEPRRNVETIFLEANASPRAQYGVERLTAALKSIGREVSITHDPNLPAGGSISVVTIGAGHQVSNVPFVVEQYSRPQGFDLLTVHGATVVAGRDDTGTLYGCLELAKRIEEARQVPADLQFSDAPSMIVRGTCIGMQKTYLLPGRKVYEYPYTPELFPWFYDKAYWKQYLDFLVDHRMNALYIWNGHPFASLVRVPDYPYAVEVPDDVLAKNQETFKYIVDEADKRGIMVMQMFYNIIVSKPFAEKNNLPSTQFDTPTPLLADYTRKSIAAFVKTYPHAGLMVCLGEALRHDHVSWMVDTIIGGIHDGMKEAGITKDIPLMLRTHAMPAEEVIPEVIKHYPTLYTESKYNGESLTTWQPRGRWRDQHLLMSKLGAIHSINIHILANLEPFRYGAQRFIKLCVQAAEDSENAKGVHLYPLSYWNWPNSPDKVADGESPLKQTDRDWIWFDAWSRYAWNPRIDEKTDHAYWVGKLGDLYGGRAAENILAAYNDSGECAPRILRRFGITEGNRQTMSLGMTLDELVRPEKYGEFTGLWEWQSPPGERLKVYAEKEWKKEPHEGETPPSIIREVLDYSAKAVAEIDAAAPAVTKNKEEFSRLRNDVHCIRAMSQNYAAKASAAMSVLRYGYSHDIADMEKAEKELEASLVYYKQLADLTKDTYQFANSMQTSQRKIPVSGGVGGKPANYHWTQLVPVYEKELADFQKQVADLKAGGATAQVAAPAAQKEVVKRLPKVGINPLTKGVELYPVQVGSKVFMDKDAVIESIAPELVGLNGVRFPIALSAPGGKLELESRAPVQLLIGYFRGEGKEWLKVPNTDVDAAAAATIDSQAVIENAAKISGMPPVDVHLVKFEKGKRALDLHGSGTYVILGVIPADVKITPHDAKGGVAGASGK
jgi:hypothetical protein